MCARVRLYSCIEVHVWARRHANIRAIQLSMHLHTHPHPLLVGELLLFCTSSSRTFSASGPREYSQCSLCAYICSEVRVLVYVYARVCVCICVHVCLCASAYRHACKALATSASKQMKKKNLR
jgi:hypothetical protein